MRKILLLVFLSLAMVVCAADVYQVVGMTDWVTYKEPVFNYIQQVSFKATVTGNKLTMGNQTFKLSSKTVKKMDNGSSEAYQARDEQNRSCMVMIIHYKDKTVQFPHMIIIQYSQPAHVYMCSSRKATSGGSGKRGKKK